MTDITVHQTPFEAAAGLPVRRPNSEATKIEQTRAVAEVQAAVTVAQARPRDTARAINEMREVCKITHLAERAFFRFPRGGQVINGASIHLARELARCWGNIDYGAKELARDDVEGASEMLAFAWDLETNTRSETTFIVPHKRDKKGGAERLVDMRDIYENNANNAARRLRECIFSVLPIWFTEMAQDGCRETLENGGGVPLPVRVSNAVDAFAKMGIVKAQLEAKVGRKSNDWTGEDVANLTVDFKSIRRGEISKEEIFPRDANLVVADNADNFEKASAAAPVATKKKEEAPAKQPEPEIETQQPDTDEATEETALSIRTLDDEELVYDDPADFAPAYVEEMKKAHKSGGLRGLNGFVETNAPSLERFAQINPTGAKALKKTHADLAVSQTAPQGSMV